jgi:hypothetical protein
MFHQHFFQILLGQILLKKIMSLQLYFDIEVLGRLFCEVFLAKNDYYKLD